MSEPTIRLTRAQVREIDRRSIEDYHIPGIVLMENAARAVAGAAVEMLAFSPKETLILCGGGNNGGDGLAVARHLHNFGVRVMLLPTIDPERWVGDAKANWEICRAMRLPMHSEKAAGKSIMTNRFPLIIDGIFGTGLQAPPRPPFEDYVRWCEGSDSKILAIDLPSGLDCDTGLPLGPCIRATKTITFVAEKAGFVNPGSREYTGEIIVGDIGCPRELIEQVRRDII